MYIQKHYLFSISADGKMNRSKYVYVLSDKYKSIFISTAYVERSTENFRRNFLYSAEFKSQSYFIFKLLYVVFNKRIKGKVMLNRVTINYLLEQFES